MNKPSQFNIVVPLDSDKSVLYNTLSRQMDVLSNSVVESFLRNDTITQDIIQAESNGFIVDHHTDELLRLKATLAQNENGIQAITILPTTDCNARCWYCYEKGIEHFNMLESVAEKTVSFIKKVYKENFIKINWFGGEPLYNFEIIRFITGRLLEEGYSLSAFFTTNGSLITEEIASFISAYYKDAAMCITVDELGMNYAKIKRYIDISEEKAFPSLIDNIKIALRSNIRLLLRLNYTEYSHAVATKDKLMSLFTEQELSHIHFYFAPIWDGTSRPQPIECAFEVLSLIEKGVDINLLANPYMDNIVLNQIGNTHKMSMCPCRNMNHYVVNADGRLYRCHSLASKKEYACGDVISGIDTSSLGYTLFDITVTDKCSHCGLLPVCQTQCRVRTLIYGDNQICENTKKILPHIVRMKANRKHKK